eukprot:4386999-Pleurochrysis_carterae.AAC.1
MALYPASCMRLAEGEEATEDGILEPFLRQERTRHQLLWESWTRSSPHRMSTRDRSWERRRRGSAISCW